MSIQVKKHPAELFMDWYPRHTKLNLRGSGRASIEKLQAMDKELFAQLAAFFTDLEKRGDITINWGQQRTEERVVVTACLLEADTPSPNGRIYPKEVLQREVERFESGRMLGTLGSSESSVVNLGDVSHSVRRLWMQGTALMAEIEVLATPNGTLLKKFIEKAVFRPVGVGSVRDNVIQPDYRLSSVSATLP